MECKTIKRVKKNGTPIIVNKKKYETLYDAQVAANNINAKPNIYIKRVVYQCSQCEYFHVGSSTEMLDNKKKITKPQWVGPRSIRLNVVGTIDLSQFDKLKEPVVKGLEKIYPSAIKKIKIRKENVIADKQLQAESKKKIKKLKRDVGQVKHGSLIWRFYSKKKVVKIITPEGLIKMPKLSNILKDAPIDVINNPLVSKRGWITEYIHKTYIQQMQ